MTSSTTRPTLPMSKTMNRLVIAAVLGVCLYLTFSMGVFNQDILAEKVVAVQVVEGGNPHLPLEDIGGDGTFAAPRTPGALLLLAPLAWVGDDLLVAGVTVLNVTAIIAVMVMSLRLAGRSDLWVVTAPLLILTIPGLYMARGTNLAPMVGLGVVSCWYLLRRTDLSWAGIPLGLAATMRVFPLWVALALIVGGRRKAGFAAVGVFAGLNLAGLLLPAVTVTGTVDTLGQTVFYRWPSNLSLAALLPTPPLVTAGIGLVALVGWLLIFRPDWKIGMLAGPIALLAGPVTWPMYLAAVGPFVPAAAVPVAVLWFLPLFGILPEPVLALSVIVMIAFKVVAWRREKALAPEPLAGRSEGVKGTRKTDVPVTADV